MPTNRLILPPHIVFLALLAIVGAAGGWRLSVAYARLDHLETTNTIIRDDFATLEKLHLGLISANHAWLTYQTQGDEPAWATFRDAMHALRTATRHQLATGSVLDNSVQFHQFQLLLDAEYARFAQANDAPTTDLPALRYEDLALLWGDLNTHVLRRTHQTTHQLATHNRRALIEAAIVFLAMILIAILYHNRVTHALDKPVQTLAATARKVRRGDLTARAPLIGDDNVRSLGQDFNRMVDRLVDSLQREEQVVQELRQLTTQLEAANRHKSQFLAAVSHELKTPLNAIIGFTDILDTGHHGDLSARQTDYIQRIGGAGRHLLAMITDLIDVAKIEAGRLEIKPTPFIIAQLLHETTAMLTPQIDAKHHTLTIQPTPPDAQITADRSRVKQILLNLLGNAIKFTPDHGHITLTATLTHDTLQLHVQDNGIGIAPADQARIFHEFVQVDSRLQRLHEGTGIGLALSRRLAHLMQGEITLTQSTPDQGSTFTLTLPKT